MSYNPGRISTASGKYLLVNNTLTLSGTDGSSVAFGAGGTVVYSGGNSNITSLTGLTGELSTPTTISMANGGVMRTTTTNAHTMSLQGYDVDGASYSNVLTVTNSNTPALSLTPTGALTITGGATSVWNLTAGNLSINAAAGTIYIGNTGTSFVYIGRAAGGVGIEGQLNLQANVDLTTSVGSSDLDFSLSTGVANLPSGNVNWNGATDKTVTFTGSGTGAFSFAAGSNGIQFSRSGSLVFDIGASSSTSVTLGANKNFACTAGTSAFNLGSATGVFTAPTGHFTWNGASGRYFYINGGARFKRTATATNYTVLVENTFVGVTSTAATRTLTLPAAASAFAGHIYVIKDESGAAGTNNIVIDGNGSETIDGATTVSITTNYGSISIYTDGTSWFTW